MIKLLKIFGILQIVSNEWRHNNGLPRLGKGYFEATRINPWNPLSYLLILTAIPFSIVIFGWLETKENLKTTFKWM